MDLWSKGLGRRVLSMTLGERDLLADSGGYLVIEGVMHAPTYWDFQVTLEEDDVVEFLELLKHPDALRFLVTDPARGRIFGTAATSAVIFLWRTLRLAATGSAGGRAHSTREVTLRRVAAKPIEDDWDEAVVDWEQEDVAALAGAPAGTDDKGSDGDARA